MGDKLRRRQLRSGRGVVALRLPVRSSTRIGIPPGYAAVQPGLLWQLPDADPGPWSDSRLRSIRAHLPDSLSQRRQFRARLPEGLAGGTLPFPGRPPPAPSFTARELAAADGQIGRAHV